MTGLADVFDELFSLMTPERLLRDPRATGEGVRVCVIDSGVERALLEEKYQQKGQVLLPIQGGIFSAAQEESRRVVQETGRGEEEEKGLQQFGVSLLLGKTNQ